MGVWAGAALNRLRRAARLLAAAKRPLHLAVRESTAQRACVTASFLLDAPPRGGANAAAPVWTCSTWWVL